MEDTSGDLAVQEQVIDSLCLVQTEYAHVVSGPTPFEQIVFGENLAPKDQPDEDLNLEGGSDLPELLETRVRYAAILEKDVEGSDREQLSAIPSPPHYIC